MNQDVIKEDEELHEIDLLKLVFDCLDILKKVWLLLVLLMAIVAAAVFIVQKKQHVPVYQAYCSFSVQIVNKSNTGELDSVYGFYYDKDLAEQLEKTFTYILTSDFLNDEVQEKIGTQTRSGNINAHCIEGSNLFVLTAYGNTPEEAEILLTTVMDVYPEAARYVVGDMNVDIVEEPIVPKEPCNTPNFAKGMLIGAAIGFVIGAVGVFLKALFKSTVNQPEDLERQVNMACLGLVPVTNIKKKYRKGSQWSISNSHTEGEFRESIRGMTRKVKREMDERQAKVLLVTSTLPHEGKTLICQSIAETLADWGNRVVLVDGDLRSPMLAERFGFKKKEMPFEEFLKGQAEEQEVFQFMHDSKICLVGNSVPVKYPTTLIDSPNMKKFIQQMSQEAEYLIIDTPPCYAMSDVALFQQYADTVLFVVRQDYATIGKIVNSIESVCAEENKTIGYVLNGAKEKACGYGKYSYGKYSYGKYGNGHYGRYKYGKQYYGKADEEDNSLE